MIVKMARIIIATHLENRDRLLNLLGKMNIVHLEPVKPKETEADKKTLCALEDLSAAIHILSTVKPSGSYTGQKPIHIAREAIELQKCILDNGRRLNDLHQKLRELKIWGNIQRTQLEALADFGFEIRFFMLPQNSINSVSAECAEVLSILPGKRVLMAVIDRNRQIKLPEGAAFLPFPSQDRPSVLAEAGKVDTELKQYSNRLSQLAASIDILREEKERLGRQILFIRAQRSGISRGALFALHGWVPVEKTDEIRLELERDHLPIAVHMEPAKPDENPPTLIQYPSWVRPMKVLFDMTGTLPGYSERDLSPFFMVALPVFAAMLIGDAGYGFLIFLAGLIFHGKIVRVANRSSAQAVIIFGVVTLVWGILTANYFGVTPETMALAGGHAKFSGSGIVVDYEILWHDYGFYGKTAFLMSQAGLLWRDDPNVSRFLVMKVSLVTGCLHLIVARLGKILALLPDLRALAEIGWIILIADMLVITWHLLFIGVEKTPENAWWILGGGLILTAVFSKPHKNIVKRFLTGLIASALPLLNTFTDTISYIRLFAVGLSSYYISSAFNAMGLQMAEKTGWLAAVPILIFGHGLNIALATIAIFAHGLRLNMLEFSNHAGVQWSGYAYRPFNIRQRIYSGEDSQ